MAKPRQETDTPDIMGAQIRCDYRGYQHCDVRNLDMHGVLVLGRDGTLTRLPKDATIDVALKLHTRGRTRTHHLRARVESRTSDGVSLVFTDADIETYSALLHLNHGADR